MKRGYLKNLKSENYKKVIKREKKSVKTYSKKRMKK